MSKEKKQIAVEGAMGTYMKVVYALLIIGIVSSVILFILYSPIRVICALLALTNVIIGIYLLGYQKKAVQKQMVEFALEFNEANRTMLKQLDVPFGLLDLGGRIIWGSNELTDVVPVSKFFKYTVSEIFSCDALKKMPGVEEDVEVMVDYESHTYRVKLRLLTPSNYGDTVLWRDERDVDAPADSLVAMMLYDETENMALKKEVQDEKMVVALLYIDNYEDACEGKDETKRSFATTWVESEINRYLKNYDTILRRLEKDKFMFIFRARYLQSMEEDGFSLLETVRNLNSYDIKFTLSIGIGVYPNMYSRSLEYANDAMTLALGRGGDQVVIKRQDSDIRYFGGVAASVEKTSKTKARVKAQALKEYIEKFDHVVVMGHRGGDTDSVGASVGIYALAKALGKRTYIVLSGESKTVKSFIDPFRAVEDYEEDMYIPGNKAKDHVDKDTLLVIVDTCVPGNTDTPDLLSLTDNVVVIDHHRQTEKKIENALLSYIETYASSTCEMVAEILQYAVPGYKLKAEVANIMYSGIVVDTGNFKVKAGVRTFEAAGYLRRNSADVTWVRKILRGTLSEYQAKARCISGAEIFCDHYIMAEFDPTGIESPRDVAAQAANEMLSIEGVKASFVFTPIDNYIQISARSIDEMNVQVVLEKLGGGGHQTIAGAQMENTSMLEAINAVKKQIIEETKETYE